LGERFFSEVFGLGSWFWDACVVVPTPGHVEQDQSPNTKVPIVNKPLSDDKLSYLVTEDCQDELVDNVSSPLIESLH